MYLDQDIERIVQRITELSGSAPPASDPQAARRPTISKTQDVLSFWRTQHAHLGYHDNVTTSLSRISTHASVVHTSSRSSRQPLNESTEELK